MRSSSVLFVTLMPIGVDGSASIGNRSIINGLADLGMDVDVLSIAEQAGSCEQEYFHSSIQTYYLKRSLVYVQGDTRGSGRIKARVGRIARSVFHKISLYGSTKSALKLLDVSRVPRRSYDVVISSSDPKTSHLCVRELKRQGLQFDRWIQYWGDPWSEDITRASVYPKFVVERIEKCLLSMADKIIYVSPLTLKEQKKLFPDIADKMTFIPIPYERIVRYSTKPKDDYFVTLGYFGSYQSDIRDIEPLYRACARHEKVRLIIVGDSDVSYEDQSNISIHRRVSKSDLMKFEEASDVFICVTNKTGTQIPGKIYHYSGTNKQIMVIVDGGHASEIVEYMSTFMRFEVCKNEEDAIYKMINELCIRDKISVEPCEALSPKEIAKKILA